MHPDTIDALFQLLLAAFNDDCPVDEEAVPYSISDIFVAADQLLEAGTSFLGYGQLTYKSECGHEIIGDLIVSDEALKFKLKKLLEPFGSEVNAFHVGRRVDALETEASKTVVRARESRVAASPSSLSSQDAVAMPIALVTAQYCLPDVSSVRRGSTVLVN
ncbi:hypothetical protein H634G_04932 [Metarhizium anisopliae BRIP 53293]|uniref:Uncharacterized protein n=1 Tax=Metarhizium anisopliae BRIP 53293 TaxID=1291518 RepID=A0A0D9NZS0_METAN|nr:hypothetical protein H634G_04932 [Metarhizium anisopliae BRIP 53293]KJK87796.1 hypothetical protein H633G_08345 [Metarhizium anisopliae BRIP 53284]